MMRLRLHAAEPFSRANGPGPRYVVWFQGCTLGCPGCFNPGTHPAADGYETNTEALSQQILDYADRIEGLSISGGEPFQQPEALLNLLQRIRGESPLSTLISSGYRIEEIETQPLGPHILKHVDVLMGGPYLHHQRRPHGLLGSTNQRLHLLTHRYQPADFHHLPTGEVILHQDGTITMTGINPLRASQ